MRPWIPMVLAAAAAAAVAGPQGTATQPATRPASQPATPPAAAPAPGPQAGDPAPPFSLPGSDGQTHTLASLAGEKVVVLAWFPKAFTGG